MNLEVAGRPMTNRCYSDLGITLKELAVSEHDDRYSDEARLHFMRALYEYQYELARKVYSGDRGSLKSDDAK